MPPRQSSPKKNDMWRFSTTLIIAGLCFASALLPSHAIAETSKIDGLKLKIEDRGKVIEVLKKEIEVYQIQIKEVGVQATNLEGAIKTLDISEKKLSAEIRFTETKVESAELKIEKLGLEIDDKKKRLALHEEGLREIIKKMRERDSLSFFEALLANARLSVLWNDTERIHELKKSIAQRMRELGGIRADLENKKREAEALQRELVELRLELSDKKNAVTYNKKEKNSLLAETRNKEQNYKKVVAEKVKRKEEFEREMFEFESQLKFELDQSKIPAQGSAILSWPVENPAITQHFGATRDAKRLYLSGTHNGIDLRAPNGTPIKAALSGKIEAVGNTDLVSGCYSYGKWILITHGNGLSTLYAHLSVISVSAGQEVPTGQIIGYSGTTGYATGPHLHFTVYASEGVTVQKYIQGKFCKNATMPVAGRSAYLNPLDYLPTKQI